MTRRSAAGGVDSVRDSHRLAWPPTARVVTELCASRLFAAPARPRVRTRTHPRRAAASRRVAAQGFLNLRTKLAHTLRRGESFFLASLAAISCRGERKRCERCTRGYRTVHRGVFSLRSVDQKRRRFSSSPCTVQSCRVRAKSRDRRVRARAGLRRDASEPGARISSLFSVSECAKNPSDPCGVDVSLRNRSQRRARGKRAVALRTDRFHAFQLPPGPQLARARAPWSGTDRDRRGSAQ